MGSTCCICTKLQRNIYQKYFMRGVKMKPQINDNMVNFLQKNMNAPKIKVQTFLKKNPDINNIDKEVLMSVITSLKKFNIDLVESLQYRKLFSRKPITLDYWGEVLLESGFTRVTASRLESYLTLVRSVSVSELKRLGHIPKNLNVQEQLIKCLSMWPTSPGMMMHRNSSDESILKMRLKTLARYLELNVDLPLDEFDKSIVTYPRIKHRPLKQIDSVLQILQSRIQMNNKKIKANFSILHANPENILMILDNVNSLGEIDIREIIRKRPILLNINYKSLQNIQQLLNENNVSLDAQRRCFEIYTLGYDTVKERFSQIKETPEYSALLDNPRFLRLIFYKKKADSRLSMLQNNKKKCITLHALSSCSSHFNSIAQSHGDSTRGVDLVRGVSNILGKPYSRSDVKKALARHNYLTKVPLINIRSLFECLKGFFSVEEIFENCHILLYPLDLVEHYLHPLLRYQESLLKGEPVSPADLKNTLGSSLQGVERLSKSEVLGLTLYFIEKQYQFTGDGLWPHENFKIKKIDNFDKM